MPGASVILAVVPLPTALPATVLLTPGPQRYTLDYMIYRKYGFTGVELSVIGFGGICVRDETDEDAARMVRTARDRGVNYFDVAPQYGNEIGRAHV